MELYQRKDGRSPFWHVDLVDEATGKRIRKSTKQTDKRAAMKVALELAKEAATKTREITLGDALTAYVDQMQADGKTSWKDARLKADKTTGAFEPGREDRWGGRFHIPASTLVSKLTPQMLLALKAARLKEGNSPGTIAAEMRILRAACRMAEEGGYVPSPIRKWGVPPPKREMRYLSPEEAMGVLHRLHPDTPVKAGSKGKLVVPTGLLREKRQDVHDLFLALVLTGGRWNEIAKMTWRQINMTDRTIVLYGWKGKKERTIPMVDEVFAMFERRAKMPRGAYVFPGKGGKARSGPTRAIIRAMTKEGLNNAEVVEAFGRATNHSLRHTYGSWLRQRGLGLDEIQPLLGHADIATTQIYAKVVDAETLSRARGALAKVSLSRK